MWLLNIESLELSEFQGNDVPVYAILSHTWALEEVSFVDMKKPKHKEKAKEKKGFHKVQQFCARAREDGYAWVWVDTCCIDKRSSAELSEAINSMFQWYKAADRCYVYVSDVPSGSDAVRMLGKSRWFERGWTLQELLAPRNIVFLAQDWVDIGYKTNQRKKTGRCLVFHRESTTIDNCHSCVDLESELSTITGIPADFLLGRKSLALACVAQRMFWASRRVTTRPEDRAYSLMGLFDISMPVLYGEGLEKAFTRLQREIISKIPDQSILLWYRADVTSYRLLAESPGCFQNSGMVMRLREGGSLSLKGVTRWTSFSMTNLGLRITLPVKSDTDESDFHYGAGVTATLQWVLNRGEASQRRLSLRLRFFRNDLEGHPIFICERPRRWTFSTECGNPVGLFLCGTDHIFSVEASFRRSLSPKLNSIPSIAMNILAKELACIPEDLDDHLTLQELGLDSLTAIALHGRIEEELGLHISITAVLSCSTTGGFRDLISQQYISTHDKTHGQKSASLGEDFKCIEIERRLE